MSRIDTIFVRARESHARLVMPFLCGGHPGSESIPALLKAMQEAGALVVEIGFPFSDPIADGPVIAAAMHDALAQGTTPETIFEQVAAVRDELVLGLVAMVSVSIVYRTGGPDGFARAAAQAGFDGVIYPDAPLGQAEAYLDAARNHGLSATLLIAPTTPLDRAKQIVKASTGFVYLLARTGITGERGEAPEIARRVETLRQWTDMPIACGFGISTPAHVRAVVEHADAAIVGSALVRHIDRAVQNGDDPVDAARTFVASLVHATTQVDDRHT